MKSMDSTALTQLAALMYILALGVMLWSMRYDPLSECAPQQPSRWTYLPLGGVAVVFHAVALMESQEGGANFSFMNALSLVSFSINAILLPASLVRPVDKLGVITFPLAALILLLKWAMPGETRTVQVHSWPMTLHILTSLLAYSFLNIAALQAILLAIQDACLRRRHPGGYLVRSLPSLQSMETLMFQLIGAGLALLTIALVTGFLYLENMFAQHLAHKTVLSLLAWLVFAILLYGRVRHGWRGLTAIRWTLGGFIALMLAYFGSKMVLEIILNRT
jgi:ABC-type uncharacterized transport system permease subunit